MYKISLEDIQIFLTVAKTRHFTKASELLFTTQPNITKRIATLEKHLEVNLITRNSKSFSLTVAGELLYEQWKPLYHQLINSIESCKNPELQASRPIRIGALYGFGYEQIAMELVHSFEILYPEVKVDFSIYNFYELSEKLDTLDIIFTTSYESETLTDYREIQLSEIPLMVSLSKKHPLAQRETLCVQELRHENLLVFSPEASPTGAKHILEALHSKDVYLDYQYIDNIPSLLLKLKDNKGICISNQELIIGNENALTTIPLTDLDVMIYNTCISKTEKHNPVVKTFIDFVDEKNCT